MKRPEKIGTLTEALNYICENHEAEKMDILLSDRLFGFLADLYKQGKQERMILQTAFSQGIPAKLAAAREKDKHEQQMVMSRYVKTLTDFGLVQNAVEDVLWVYAEALGWEKRPKVGDIILFGGYDWRVLDFENNKALLISKDILEKRRFNDWPTIRRSTINIWASSELHQYLNGEFFSGFSADDKSRVYHSSEGNVFLPSIDEARKYFKNDADRVAKYNGKDEWWWLRSPGNFEDCSVKCVRVNGDFSTEGYHAAGGSGGVRPAMWVRLGN